MDHLMDVVARQLSISIEPENLHLPSPLSAFGEYEVLVPVANGSELIEAVITIDVLRRSRVDVTVASWRNSFVWTRVMVSRLSRMLSCLTVATPFLIL
ncbi:hypothetical protein WN944_014227 [Citrus x changshan-huyou]|uniref:Uncharacterized protein n=1 Tax=Citrus x changshan-huyou TaxID=2935761 RepID=A0AAP0QLH5_9ROSI